MKKLMSAFVVVGLLSGVFATHAKAGEQKIALVNLQEALNNVKEGVRAKDNLKKQFEKKKKEIDKEKATLQKEAADLQKQGSVLSGEARQKKAQELQKKFMELQTKAANYERELKMAEAESATEIIKKLGKHVEEISKKKGYTLVIENSQRTVLFAANAEDITSDLINAYNKKNR